MVLPFTVTDRIYIAGPGEEVLSVLVVGDCHDPVREEECLLDAVPVVDVYVDIDHTRVELEQLQYAKYDIIHVTES